MSAAGRYAARLEASARPDEDASGDDGRRLAGPRRDCARIRRPDPRAGGAPDGSVEYADPGTESRARSTVIAQAIHHATEHRAQIAGALATNGVDTIDLDALDLWAYTEAEDVRA